MQGIRRFRRLLVLLVPALLVGCGAQSGQEPDPGAPTSILVMPGIVLPTTRPAAAAWLRDNETVVGVVVAGKARAYALRAVAPMSQHVIDDVVGKSPVTVTYCLRTDCVRAFTGDGTAPLPIKTGGYRDGLLLAAGNDFFDQKTGTSLTTGQAFPFRQLPSEKTTWGEWKKHHPDTDVFDGS